MLSRTLLTASSRRLRSGIPPIVSSSFPPTIGNRDHDAVHGSSSSSTTAQCNTRFIRSYHATPRQEIVPLIAVGAVVAIGRWSWKALNRMDQDWADYQWELERWERQQARSGNLNIPTTIGADIGSVYSKIASTFVGQPTPTLLETPQGERLRFVVVPAGRTSSSTFDSITLSGSTALEKFFYKPKSSTAEERVTLPYQRLASDALSTDEASKLVNGILGPAIDQVMERVAAATQNDANKENKASSFARTVVTLPPKLYNQYSQAIESSTSDGADEKTKTNEIIVIPDPVAAVWGAQTLKFIPEPVDKDDASSVLVVDVGGLETTISLVDNNSTVTSFATIQNVGGEAMVQELLDRILKETTEIDQDGNATMTLANDPMSLGLIAKEARQAVLALVHKNNSDLHIPYLLMGRPGSSDPHFNLNLSRTVLEQSVEDRWRDTVYPALLYGDEKVLSLNLPPPTNVATMFSSVATKLLEDVGRTPDTLDHVLVVGGGSRHPLFQKAVQDGIGVLMPPEKITSNDEETPPKQQWVCPEPSTVRAELTAVGAASLLPTQTYTYEDGLRRLK